ncbi:MAG: leucyl aminopeptidase [Anaerolineales bacterium]
MEIKVERGSVCAVATDLLVVNVLEGVAKPSGATGAVDAALQGAIAELITAGDIKGKEGEVTLLYPRGQVPATRVLVVGLGKQSDLDANAVRKAAAVAARKAQDLGVAEYCTIAHGAGAGGLDPALAAQAVVEGTVLGSYHLSTYLTQQEARRLPLAGVTLLAYSEAELPALQTGAAAGKAIAEAVCLARDLINIPGNDLPPSALAARAQQVATESGLACTILDEAQMKALGMGALLAVGKGSDQPSQFIVLEYHADYPEAKPYVVVGKGITFDSGGISLKPGQGMEDMKDDMAGAAAVLGVMQAVAALGLPIRVVGLAPCVENMPSGKASRPGDVVQALNGLTVEIISTDAEGRLILADALGYAQRYQPQAVVDLATLTGGCVVALGHVASGLMANDDALAAQLEQAAKASGEKTWRLPLWPEYEPQIKSDIADIKNSGGREASAITGGLFLQHFADYPWAHLDIAGMALANKAEGWTPKGGTGYGVRLIVEWLRERAAAQS